MYFDGSECSGGPLLDSKGHMIGINTAIFTQTGYLISFLVTVLPKHDLVPQSIE